MKEAKHHCKENDIPGVNILFGPSISNDWASWVLENKVYATEQDVKSGEADSVGEEISGSTISVKYCPFCGLELNGI